MVFCQKPIIKKKKAAKTEIIEGQAAFPGFVRGRVWIVTNCYDLKKIKNNRQRTEKTLYYQDKNCHPSFT